MHTGTEAVLYFCEIRLYLYCIFETMGLLSVRRRVAKVKEKCTLYSATERDNSPAGATRHRHVYRRAANGFRAACPLPR